MVCLAALAHAVDLDLETAGDLELARNWTNADKIREKWKNKPEFSPLPAEPTITDEQLAISGLNKDWNMAMHRAHNVESVTKRLFEENALMRSVIEAGDDLYASLAKCDDNELSKFQRASRDTYAAVSNAYRAPLIAINEEAHGNV